MDDDVAQVAALNEDANPPGLSLRDQAAVLGKKVLARAQDLEQRFAEKEKRIYELEEESNFAELRKVFKSARDIMDELFKLSEGEGLKGFKPVNVLVSTTKKKFKRLAALKRNLDAKLRKYEAFYVQRMQAGRHAYDRERLLKRKRDQIKREMIKGGEGGVSEKINEINEDIEELEQMIKHLIWYAADKETQGFLPRKYDYRGGKFLDKGLYRSDYAEPLNDNRNLPDGLNWIKRAKSVRASHGADEVSSSQRA